RLAGSGQSSNVVAVVAFEQRLQVQAEGQLDRLAGGPCRSDDDDSPSRGLGCEECLRIGREEVVAGDAHYCNIERIPKTPFPLSTTWRGGTGGEATSARDDTGARNRGAAARQSRAVRDKQLEQRRCMLQDGHGRNTGAGR